MENIIHFQNIFLFFILSIVSSFITDIYSINIFDLFKNKKNKLTIFYTFYLLNTYNNPQIAFYFLKDYFVVTKFPQYDFSEKRRLSLIEIVKESLPTFLILSALYWLLT